jgi:hypothetical protein
MDADIESTPVETSPMLFAFGNCVVAKGITARLEERYVRTETARATLS